jgi:predicted MPP superfamily phosphohydrolase
VDDLSAARITDDKLKETLKELDGGKYNIVLSHEPEKFDIFAGSAAGLVLCGHTHDGQIFPFNLLVKLRYKHNYGLYKIKDTYFYVTSGAFYWGPPMRLFTKNEIAVINVEKI